MKFVSYLRLSKKKTVEQYGLPAQKEAIARYLASQPGAELIGEFTEHESGAVNNRPQLLGAIALAKSSGAVLCVARLDRLSRSASFLLTLRDSGLAFVCCDFPQMDRLTCGILALVAEKERELISARIRAALAVVRQRKKLGCPVAAQAWTKAMVSIQERKRAFVAQAVKSIDDVRSTGIEAHSRIAECLNKRGERCRMGGKWTATAVARILRAAGR